MQHEENKKQFIKGDKWYLLSYKLGNRSHLTLRKVTIVKVRNDGDIEVQTNDGILLVDDSSLVKVVDLLCSV